MIVTAKLNCDNKYFSIECMDDWINIRDKDHTYGVLHLKVDAIDTLIDELTQLQGFRKRHAEAKENLPKVNV